MEPLPKSTLGHASVLRERFEVQPFGPWAVPDSFVFRTRFFVQTADATKATYSRPVCMVFRTRAAARFSHNAARFLSGPGMTHCSLSCPARDTWARTSYAT